MKNAQSPVVTAAPHFAGTPGGFQLLDFLNTVNSPFQSRTSPGNHAAAGSSSPMPAPREEWNEALVQDMALQLWDWSLKCRMVLECQPFLNLRDDVRTKHDAQRVLTTGQYGHAKNSPSVLWHASLLYWQYPSSSHIVHETKSSLLQHHPVSGDRDGVSQTAMSHGESNNNLLEALEDVVSMPPPNSGTATTRNDAWARKREWQEAFLSLYGIWMEATRKSNSDGDDVYFYAMGRGHTTLFRGYRGQPEIVLSSCSRMFRMKMRQLGVRLVLLDSRLEFHEGMIQASAPANTEDSPNVRAELTALRRAQVGGENVGASVSVSMNPKRRASTSSFVSPPRMPPLLISGWDDCAAFAEVYLNALGHTHVGLHESWRAKHLPSQMPTLFSRELGSFLHASLKTLHTRSKRHGHDDVDPMRPGSIHVQGTILPCAFRRMMAAVTATICSGVVGPGESSNGELDAAVGSTHIIVHLKSHAGVEGTPVAGSIGSAHSRKFNARQANPNEMEGDATSRLSYGEFLSTVVCDGTRPTAVVYKVSQDDAVLMG